MSILRRAYVISDLHLGGEPGFRLCSRVWELATFVRALASQPVGEPRIELIVNGDFVDFLTERDELSGAWVPFVGDGAAAASRLETIASRNREVFDAMHDLLAAGHRLVLLLGNHDIELSLPDVRRKLADLLRITARHDFQFVYDGEAYIVGDALIEHGDQYDRWNAVDYESLRRYRAWQSRNRPEGSLHRFTPPAGSRLVSDVINPIKERYQFVDLLKPETAAVVPLLLALEPGFRRLAGEIASLWVGATSHRAVVSAIRYVVDDIAADGGGVELLEDDLVARAGIERTGVRAADPLHVALEHVMPGEAARFLAAIDAAPDAEAADSSGTIVADIASTSDSVNWALGLWSLLVARQDASIDRRMGALLRAVRVLQNDSTFHRDSESFPEYRRAAEALSRSGFRFVVFGHTHLARDIRIDDDARYLNSGTWADLMQFPPSVLGGPDGHALEATRKWVEDLRAGTLTEHLLFRPTYVRLDVERGGRVVRAELVDYQAGDTV